MREGEERAKRRGKEREDLPHTDLLMKHLQYLGLSRQIKSSELCCHNAPSKRYLTRKLVLAGSEA